MAKRIQQKPIPDNVMTAYKSVLFKNQKGDGWHVCVYLHDSFGRKWSIDLDAPEPRMLAGEQLAPNEIIETEDEE